MGPPAEFVQKTTCFLQSEAFATHKTILYTLLSENGLIITSFYLHQLSEQSSFSQHTSHVGLHPSSNNLSNSVILIVLSCDDGLGPSLRNGRISGKGGEEGMNTSKTQGLVALVCYEEGGDACDNEARLFRIQVLGWVV